ncbi:small ubiquitin-related modifier 1-like isoform X1 [Salvia miltiorrhiza]|uniref:small ubiquitin-related modifier 1-like isoform X1 n=1 Tax=Salvia miltiorrhiza TaxID=226208 RepID=UPI0025ABB719|nr:small ubiquitin-related modifier 1-like isoform X1 [Salvia miltiorrhiza]
MSTPGTEEDKKPGGDQSGHINLKVKGQDGNEVFFRIKRSTQLKKLMNAYCDRQSVDLSSIAFLFDGRRLRAEQTPDEVFPPLIQFSFSFETHAHVDFCLSFNDLESHFESIFFCSWTWRMVMR